ncbi:MAG: hypothetical protein J2O49_02550 [Sciscionella sp.]|nr:hypothetical protein [Sciscionella sp.]
MGLTEPPTKPSRSSRRPSSPARPTSPTQPTGAGPVGKANPVALFVRLVNWFETRGVYLPGEEAQSLSPWRDLGWPIALLLVSIGLFLVFFAIAT